METEPLVSREMEDQLRTFLRNFSDVDVANMLYIIAEWPEEFIQYCYEHEIVATEKFAKMLETSNG